MMNRSEADELTHLEYVKGRLRVGYAGLDARVRLYANEVEDQKRHLWENKGDMDHVEKAWTRELVQQGRVTGAAVADARRRIEKLIESPYFGRFDFIKGGGERLAVYVGVHSFFDDDERVNLVFDWRAPIASMFYDYELGQAKYRAPSGEIVGRIEVKRQYRIRGGQLEFMLESGLNIIDDVLQKELSRTSDDRMKHIVATIQRDQNAIIRNEDAQSLIIQGVAGSGKTSIALHRIAFLLYRHRDTLASKDVLIISPNKVFADFISSVLPELGEEPIAEMQMEGLAHAILEGKVTFQSAFDQATAVVDKQDEVLLHRIARKASFEFLEQLERYTVHVEASRFDPQPLQVARHVIPVDLIAQAWRKYRTPQLTKRIRDVAEVIERHLRAECGYEITSKERAEIRASLRKMTRNLSLNTVYKELFDWLGAPELFVRGPKRVLEHSDVFPLVYLKLRLEGVPDRFSGVKHLVVDEMQDYTPVQYSVLNLLFSCDKTILGDVHQSIGGVSTSSAEAIARVVRDSDCVILRKSYRSSWEITRFAQGVCPDADLVAIERHGDKPRVLACASRKAEVEHIRRAVARFEASDLQTMGIICKTQGQAARLHEQLRAGDVDVHLITAISTNFIRGVSICTTHLAKGLEFDHVVVPDTSAAAYATPLDRNLLYVACTRAMHHLTLTHTGALTPFISDRALYEAA